MSGIAFVASLDLAADADLISGGLLGDYKAVSSARIRRTPGFPAWVRFPADQRQSFGC